MSDEKRYYRQNVATHGLIYLAGTELTIKIKNLSITGMLVVLEKNEVIHDVKDIFDAIRPSSIVDFYIPDMLLEGEAELVRVDMIDEGLYLALDFSNLSYNVDNQLYQRKAYRKNMTAPGQIVIADRKYSFETKNVSVDGLMILLNETIEVEPGIKTIFDFPQLKLRGVVKVVWVEHLAEGGAMMGLHYEQIQKRQADSIPRFNPDLNDLN